MSHLMAHRGFRSSNSENRMIDFQKALGTCTSVEFDIRLTKDNKIIIFHDETFERIGDAKIFVKDLTYQEILNLSFFVNNKEWIPILFSDFIKKLSHFYKIINVEIKEDSRKKYNDAELETIFSEINKLPNYTQAEIIVSAFDINILNEIEKQIKKPIKKAYLFNSIAAFDINYAKRFDYLHPPISVAINSEMIQTLKKLKKPLNIWTFTTNEQAQKIYKIYQEQVFNFISDNEELSWKS